MYNGYQYHDIENIAIFQFDINIENGGKKLEISIT